jgi:tetratricopeptide (TPR) repeat protein
LTLLGVGFVVAACARAQDPELREPTGLDARQKCAEGESYYKQALAKGPVSSALLNNLGNHYVVCRQPDRARPYFERLLTINPSHLNANMQMARIELDRKHWTEALKHLAQLNQSNPAVRIVSAEALHGAGNRPAALAILDSVEKESNGDPRVLFTVGLTFARVGLYDRAEADFNAALLRKPDSFDVIFNLGRAAARAQHFDRAERALDAALKLNPADADALFELGLVHAARQNSSRAVYLLAQARQRAPQRADITLALARAAEDAGYYGDSSLAYDEYLKLKPDDDTARRDRARVYGYTGKRLAEGLKELGWYVSKHPGDAVGYYYLAQLTWAGNPETALDQLSKALRLDSSQVTVLYARAWLLHRLGRAADSVLDLQDALRMDPSNLRALDQLGLSYLALDRPSEAESVLRRALVVSAADPEVLLHLGRALTTLDREAEAQHFLDEYRKVRPQRVRDARKEPGMIELATLSEAERTRREIERLRHDARAHPSDPELQLQLAKLLLSEGRMEEAKNEFNELMTRNADSRTSEQAGTALLRAQEYKLARDFLQRALPERPTARLDLAIAHLFTDGPNQALQVLDGAPEGERAGDYFFLKARILEAAGQVAEAEKSLQMGLTNSVSHPEIAEQATLLLLQHHRKAEALDLVAQAVGTNPDNAGLLLLHVIVLGMMGQNSSAERRLKQIESRWPEWDRPYLVEGLMLEHDKRFGEARQKYRTAQTLGSQDPALTCAFARVTASSNPGPECACSGDLYSLLVPSCGRP